ncbi:MAG: Omp28 family outer membrane lipoprotein [Candidatus Symbiothrix sp.]|jgi:hypothetical protein|nr:Omp28 family outer membrane lipoprotein [Candidatus Symbiothrix sp.]
MKKTILFLIVIFAFAGSGCDVINENERTIEMDEIIPLKKVLLLDFTDQRCANCPKAGIEVAGLKENYGEALVPVTIHASANNLPLVTEDGNIYDAYFGTNKTGHPAGIIDGKLFPAYETWGGGVLERFNIYPAIDMDLSATYRADTREIAVVSKLKALKEMSNAKLLLWIIENNVIAAQLQPDGSYDNNYVHQHIFRAAINGTWGEELRLGAEEEKTVEHSCLLPEKWKPNSTSGVNPENISLVAFVYNATSNEVYDATEIKLVNN